MEESGKAPKLENQLPVPTGPELLVLVPEVAGSQIFQVNRFRTNDDAAAFVRTSISPKLLPSTHVFWARHECPPPGNEPAGGEALVLIRADADQELVQIVSLVDLPAATSFVRFEVRRGLDPASVMIYWASFSPLAKEMAAGVLASPVEEPEMPEEAEEASAEDLDEAEEPSGSGSLGKWAMVPVAGLLLFIGGVFFLRPAAEGSGDEESSVAAAAVQSQEDVAAAASSPTATAAPSPAPEASDAAPAANDAASTDVASTDAAGNPPAGDDPAPAPAADAEAGSTGASAPPPPTATPKPTPTPLPRSSHIGDLDGSAEDQGAKKTKLLVKIVVHDAAHRPVAGATVSGEWTGGFSGPASCVTASDGTCMVATKPLNSGVRAKFSISGIVAGGLPYDATINHDPDGDSNGTSITVRS